MIILPQRESVAHGMVFDHPRMPPGIRRGDQTNTAGPHDRYRTPQASGLAVNRSVRY